MRRNKNKIFTEKSSRHHLNNFWAWVGVGFGIVALFFVLRSFLMEWEKKKAIDREVMTLQAEIEKIKKENSDMQDKLRYLKTESFQEKELRDKLNLVKEGEKVIYVKEGDSKKEDKNKKTESLSIESSDKKAEILIKRSNYYYWWEFIFGKKEEDL